MERRKSKLFCHLAWFFIILGQYEIRIFLCISCVVTITQGKKTVEDDCFNLIPQRHFSLLKYLFKSVPTLKLLQNCIMQLSWIIDHNIPPTFPSRVENISHDENHFGFSYLKYRIDDKLHCNVKFMDNWHAQHFCFRIEILYFSIILLVSRNSVFRSPKLSHTAEVSLF